MFFDQDEDLLAIREGVEAVCRQFPDEYWRNRDEDGHFPHEFHRAMAEGGWLGITMPEEFGGQNLGVSEAAMMMHAVGKGGGGMTAASTIQINLFGPHPILLFGSDAQKERFLPPLVRGEDKVAFGVTEPNAGLDTTSITTYAEKVEGGWKVNGRKIWTTTGQVATKYLLLCRTTKREDCKSRSEGITLFYTDFDRDQMEVQRIPKMARKAVDSNMVFIDDLFIPDEDLIGEVGKGFRYILTAMNAERVIIGAVAAGLGMDALSRAANYAQERVVFGRQIGMNQGIQHPLADSWMELEAAWLMCQKAARMYDAGQPCGAEANAAKFLAAQAGHKAAERAVLTHGGMGVANEYNVERLYRESMIMRIAPISEQMIRNFIGEHVLGMPKSY
ncbi:MAG: acyl-CoA/acyl-ACP dehydrogenase [Halioglobus sp.]|nr:acyl-CoA/acyl-ACP dehydrogenase [Halioglobus sp.]